MGLGRPHIATEKERGGELIYCVHENPPLASAGAALDETTEKHWQDIMADFVDQMLDVDRARTDHDVGELRRELAELKLKVAECSGAVRRRRAARGAVAGRGVSRHARGRSHPRAASPG
jgi:hypothetical protein